jgi:hypothetical protein
MKKAAKFTVVAAGALALTSMFGLSASAQSRRGGNDDSWRNSRQDSRYERRDDRDFLRGEVERVDRRRGVVVLRETRGGRSIVVEMSGRGSSRGIDVGDLRRGDYVTFAGDWSRNGVFTARRIDNVDSGRRNNRDYRR